MMFQREPVYDLWDEVLPLLQQHWQEISRYKDIKLDPSVEEYNTLEEAGLLRVYTARGLNQELVGYAAYFVRGHMHYRSTTFAVQDVLFLRKDHRQGFTGVKLIKYADSQLAQEGVDVVCHHVKTANEFGPVLKRLGYEHVENIYMRRL